MKNHDRDDYNLRSKRFCDVQFAQFDPRQTLEAVATNDDIFAAGQVIGIEVTISALAKRCELGNIDPQHSDGDSNLSAIEAALEIDSFWMDYDAPRDRPVIVMATVRPDLDSIGAMAVLEIRIRSWTPEPEPYGLPEYYEFDGKTARRIRSVANLDKFNRGGWPGKRNLPTVENLWPEEEPPIEASELAAVAACVSDFREPIKDRVEAMEEWLLRGEIPDGYREKVMTERVELVRALEDGDIKIIEGADSHIVVVETTHRAATVIGYMVAPVVVALNPEFRFQGGDAHSKLTVCQFEADYVDLKAVALELSEFEDGWGGSPTIIGSPQGIASVLTIDQVVEVVERHMR